MPRKKKKKVNRVFPGSLLSCYLCLAFLPQAGGAESCILSRKQMPPRLLSCHHLLSMFLVAAMTSVFIQRPHIGCPRSRHHTETLPFLLLSHQAENILRVESGAAGRVPRNSRAPLSVAVLWQRKPFPPLHGASSSEPRGVFPTELWGEG